ncbi:cobalamin biosynthesis protein, partial [Rhodococcus opacus PD630]
MPARYSSIAALMGRSFTSTATLVDTNSGVHRTSRPATARAAGLLLGFAADRVFADPVRWHPVAGFGRTAMALEKTTYRDSRSAG